MRAAEERLPCSVAEMPDELLLEIASLLTVTRGFSFDKTMETERQMKNASTVQALRALTLTCHKFRAIATPQLYKSIVPPRGRTQIPPFLLRSLLEKPDAARSIEYIGQYNHTLPAEEEADYYVDKYLDLYAGDLARADWRYPDFEIAHLSNLIPYDRAHHTPRDCHRASLSYHRCEHPPEFAIMTIVAMADNLSEVAISHVFGNALADVVGYK